MSTPANRKPDPQQASVADALATAMKEASLSPRRTKRSAARLAIAAAIRKGVLKPGDYLPPEVWLTEILGVSLGTVQAALRQLQQMGAIVRRRGDGTRVASAEPLGRDIWHFRFVDKRTSHPLRISKERLSIDRVSEAGEWTDFLGGALDYVRIRRQVTLQDGTLVGAEMFLNAKAVPGLETVDPEELDMVNIRPYLEERFAMAAADASHVVQTGVVDAVSAEAFGLARGLEVLEIHARAITTAHKPVYYQRILVPSEGCGFLI
ncbi:MAG: GntR family transcriptional regulator [Pseudomonadota bacterium]